MLRGIGVGLILGACLWFAAYFAAKERYRLQEWEELERGLLLLQSQISYLSAPLAEGMESISRKLNGSVGEVFAAVGERMAARDGASAEEIWNAVWLGQAGHLFLTGKDLEEILLFGKSLGYLDRTQQENSIRLFLREIALHLEQGRKRLEKNGRLYYGIGGFSGLLLVVTLL